MAPPRTTPPCSPTPWAPYGRAPCSRCFPEGTTHDDPSIRPLRTGVARIALQAAGSGVRAFASCRWASPMRTRWRSGGRALVSYGRPIEVPADPTALAGDGAPDPDRVHDLTRRLQSDIEALTPHFDTTEEALALSAAATVSLRDDAGEVVLVPMAAVAARAAPAGGRRPGATPGAGVVGGPLPDAARLRRHRRRGRGAGHRSHRPGPADRGVGRGGDRVGAAGRGRAVANLVPAVLVLVAGLVPKAPVSKGTVRLLVAAITFPVTWLFLALRDAHRARCRTWPAA